MTDPLDLQALRARVDNIDQRLARVENAVIRVADVVERLHPATPSWWALAVAFADLLKLAGRIREDRRNYLDDFGPLNADNPRR